MNHLTKTGAPKYVNVYQVKRNPTLDCMTIVFTHAHKFMGETFRNLVYYISASRDALGFWQHGSVDKHSFYPGGSLVKWVDLEGTLKLAILNEYQDLWEIKFTGYTKENGYCPTGWEARKDAGCNNSADTVNSG